MKAIILDGHLKSALASVRALGYHDIFIISGSYRKTAPALHSRFNDESFIYRDPLKDKDGFVDDVFSMVKKCDEKPVIFTFSDSTFLPLFEKKEELSKIAHFIAPEKTSVDIAFDKIKTIKLAKSFDVPTIKTYLPKEENDIHNLSKALIFPVVVKPRESVTWLNNKGVFGSAHIVLTDLEFKSVCLKIFQDTGLYPLVQEFIEGKEYGVEYLYQNGKVLASCAHKRIRSLSPKGGASVVKRTIPQTTGGMDAYARKLLKELKWTGPVMVEFKQNSNTKEFLLMEINGRFWGSLPLSIFAEVDFPYLYFNLAKGEVPDIEVVHMPGVVSRHFLGDIKHLLTVLFKKDALRDRLYPTRKQAWSDFLTAEDSVKFDDVFMEKDKKPYFYEMLDIMKKYLWL